MRLAILLYCGATACLGAEYTIHLGDSAPFNVARIVADGPGATYVAGTEDGHAVVAKLDPSGNTVFRRDLSGSGPDTVSDLAVDAAGNVYVAGATSSTDFPLHNAMQAAPGPGFLAKVSADGSQVIWATYFREPIGALAVDTSGAVFITGSTNDSTFPVTAGLPQGLGPQGSVLVANAFLVKLSPEGDRIVYSTLINGTQVSCGSGSSCYLSPRSSVGVSVSVDGSGEACLAGDTGTIDLPTTPGALLKSGIGAFAMKVKADGSGLVYLTYIGATNYITSPFSNPANTATAIACDAAGYAYVAGTTFDPRFPATAGAFQTVYAGPTSGLGPQPADAFVLKLKPDGSGVVWASYLGGSGAEALNSLAIDASGQAWLAGTTASSSFPNAQGWSQGKDFLSGFSADGSKLVYSARYPDDGAARSVSVDGSGVVHVAGPTGIVSTVVPGAAPLPRIWGISNAAGGPLDWRASHDEVVSIYGPHIGAQTAVVAVPDASGNIPTTIAGVQVFSTAGYLEAFPLLFVSDSQINAVISVGYLSSTLYVAAPQGQTPNFPITIVADRPAVFHNPDGSAIMLNQDGTMNSFSNPASAGSWVAVWATGAGGGNPDQIAQTAADYKSCAVLIGSQFVPVSYAGAAPGAVGGIVQINFQAPAIPPGVTGPGASQSAFRVMAADGSLSAPVSFYSK